MSLATVAANEPRAPAAWVEGLLKGSGLLLLHGDAMWDVIDAGSRACRGPFHQVLPLLRGRSRRSKPPSAARWASARSAAAAASARRP
jgi:hypothetical protein